MVEATTIDKCGMVKIDHYIAASFEKMLNSSNLSEPLNGSTDSLSGGTPTESRFPAGIIARIQSSPLFGSLAGLRQKMRPWMTDFVSPNRFSRPNDDWTQRVRVNLTYYKVKLFGKLAIL